MSDVGGMIFIQKPDLKSADKHLQELKGKGYNGYVMPIGVGKDTSHEIRAWKDK